MILDTNAVSALLSGESSFEERLATGSSHHLPVIVIGEYLFGIAGSRRRARFRALFQDLIDKSYILDVDHETAEIYAQIRGELKLKGRPIPVNDVWIAALARQHNLPVATRVTGGHSRFAFR